MLRRILLSTLFLGAALAGCSPSYPKCEKDEQCSAHNEVCINGSCQECGRDADCKAGFACDGTRCLPKPECAADADCADGLRCRAGACASECESDGQCASGMVCKASRCRPEAECTSDRDCSGGMRCDARGRCEQAQSATCGLETIYFEFDRFTLTPEARRTLDQNADCLRARDAAITLAGHADDRGTEEYNLHLGEKRAQAVRSYLVKLGVEPARLATISFGEERPAVSGADEAAWSKNRRVEFAEGERHSSR